MGVRDSFFFINKTKYRAHTPYLPRARERLALEEEQSASYNKISQFIAVNTALLCDFRPWSLNISKYISFT